MGVSVTRALSSRITFSANSFVVRCNESRPGVLVTPLRPLTPVPNPTRKRAAVIIANDHDRRAKFWCQDLADAGDDGYFPEFVSPTSRKAAQR